MSYTRSVVASTQVLFVSHASLLIRWGSEYLLTDPWFQRPAFGSWLPNPPPALHPAYLAGLGSSLRILISHAHDDHCDDEFLQLFSRDTEIITSDYPSRSVERRLRQLGFQRLCLLKGEEPVTCGAFTLRGYRLPMVSPDDALYSIRTPDALVIHCNDLWNPLPEDVVAALRGTVSEVGTSRALYASQTNSASGYPLSYRCFSPAQKRDLLHAKVLRMIQEGLKNAERVGAANFLSYAGFSSVFVQGKEEYLEESIHPDHDFIKRALEGRIPLGVQVLDLRPGDVFDFERVLPGFTSRGTDPARLRRATEAFYAHYKLTERCDSFRSRRGTEPLDAEALLKELAGFLLEFESFVRERVARTGFEATVIGKALTFRLEDVGVEQTVKFGEGLVSGARPNKLIAVSGQLMRMVIDGEILLENLYTGFNAELDRDPPEIYNRDLVMYLVMFSYAYLNRRRAKRLTEPPTR